jgi:hypothetical protein
MARNISRIANLVTGFGNCGHLRLDRIDGASELGEDASGVRSRSQARKRKLTDLANAVKLDLDFVAANLGYALCDSAPGHEESQCPKF